MARESADARTASSQNDRKEKGPAIKGSDAGPRNARAGEAGTGTRSGRKAGDVHRPTNVTVLDFASSIIQQKGSTSMGFDFTGRFPAKRMRRMRRDDFSRRLVRETRSPPTISSIRCSCMDGATARRARRRRCRAFRASRIDLLLRDAERCVGARHPGDRAVSGHSAASGRSDDAAEAWDADGPRAARGARAEGALSRRWASSPTSRSTRIRATDRTA